MLRSESGSRAILLLVALLVLSLARVESGAVELSGRPLERSLLEPVTLSTAPLPVGPIILFSGRDPLFRGGALWEHGRRAWALAEEWRRSWGGHPPD